MTSNTLKTLIEEKPFVTCPGVFDLVSAKLADRTKADAFYMTGYGAVASYLGLPDAGLDRSRREPRPLCLNELQKRCYSRPINPSSACCS